MLAKSICVMTLMCLMGLFSVSCDSFHIVYNRQVIPATATNPVEETVIARVDVYPSPLQFAN